MPMTRLSPPSFFAAAAALIGLPLATCAQTWTQINTGTTASLNAIHCPSTSTCYAVGTVVLAKTTNGGGSWAFAGPIPTISQNYHGVHCPDENTCYAAGVHDGTSYGLIRKTVDGGGNWAQQASGPTSPSNSLNAVHCWNANTCIAVGNLGVVQRTTNGGTTWSGSNTGIASSSRLFAVQFVTADTVFAAGVRSYDTSGVVFHSTNGGASWTDQGSYNFSSPVSRFEGVHFVNSRTGWLAGWRMTGSSSSGLIYKTVDGGQNWVLQPTTTAGRWMAIHFTDASKGYAAGYQAGNTGPLIASTSDGGATWAYQNLTDPNRELSTLSFPASGTGYAAGTAGAYKLDLSTGLAGTSGSFKRPVADKGLFLRKGTVFIPMDGEWLDLRGRSQEK